MEDFSAQENVMIPMRRLGHLPEAAMRERAAELLDAVDLANKLDRPSRHLSGGEQQRVAIARALANDPRVILADEPTGNLDTKNSQRAFDLLQRIVQEKQKALLLVTHNPMIAEACDWVHEMKDGRIITSHPRALFQVSAKNAIASLLFCRRPRGTSCNVMVRRCCGTVRIMAEAGTTYLSILPRSSQPLIQMSSM
jgi:ABC-type lipoprotein export system ATPase subunit